MPEGRLHETRSYRRIYRRCRMMIGGALAAVTGADIKPTVNGDGDVMNPSVAGQAMLRNAI